jgi:hypothetical protein
MKSVRKAGLTIAAAYIALVTAQGLATAKGLWVKQAKDLGYPAQNCLYCHTEKLPKKDTFKVEQLNDRGKWLMAEKDKNKAKEVDLKWLKDYPGGNEQK